MVWLESPTNPLLKITDIKAVADSLKSHRQDIILVVDNTFLTCYFQVNSTHNSMRKIFRYVNTKYNTNIFYFQQKPLELGADIVMYSLTKYINGHSDVIMGAAITRRDDLAEKLRFLQNGKPIKNFSSCIFESFV